MENQKNNKGVIALLVVIIVILSVLCVLFATGIITFNSNKVNDNDINENVNEGNGTTEDNSDDDSQENNYAVWMNYILEQNITNVNINRSRYADNPDDEYHAKINLTTEQLKGLFSKLKNYTLVKYYLQGSGFTYGDIITISYSVNNTNYSVKIANGQLWADDVSIKDSGLLNALENSDHTVENEEFKNMEGAFYNYRFQGYEDTILDEYFK